MKKEEMKKIENLLKDFNFDFEMNEDKSKYLLRKSNYNEIIEFLNEENEDNISIDNFEIKSQIHISRDRDIKLDMRKIDNYNIKLIYHRKKDSSKEYRLFISFKNENKELKRIRYINDSIKKIHSDENKMIELFNKINKNQIEKYLNEKIS